MNTKLIGFALLLALLASAMPAAASVPAVINYQGRLTQPSGAPVADGTYSMLFSIYAAPTGGTALWSETNPSVAVKGGLFAAMLGSVTTIPATIFDSPTRYFAVKVGSDPEMTPRQQIASVGYAVKAGSADVAATANVATSVVDGAITAAKLATGVAIPPGGVIMWSGAVGAIPTGWALCDGTNGTPNLRDKFIVGAGSAYAVGATGGEAFHTLTVAEMPSHRHPYHGWGNNAAGSPGVIGSDANNTAYTDYVGGDQPHENRPPYYALCYIMKLAY